MLLEAQDITVYYDTALLLNRVSLEVDKGEIVGLVGPNGAGKTTFFRTIAGLVRWEKEASRGTGTDISISGEILFDGDRIEELDAHERVERGLVLCPERRKIFPEMTVLKNLKAGGWLQPSDVNKKTLDEIFQLLPLLEERRDQIAGEMSGGEQQMLAIGRALMAKPELLCIDEPSLGLAPKLKERVFDRVKEIAEEGITILLAEQDISLAFELVERSYILSAGQIVKEGETQELLEDEKVRETYLGI